MRSRQLVELDILDGLQDIVLEELETLPESSFRDIQFSNAHMRFDYRGDLAWLLQLRSIIAAYQYLYFDVPRPKALLGHQHFSRIIDAAHTMMRMHGQGAFQTLRLSAAGEDSTVMLRLRDELAAQLGLQAHPDEGDLLLRLRRSSQKQGWELLLRLSPRPLATRSWRVCNLPGAMNASLAYAMVHVSQPQRSDRILNICCGSGTLLAERMDFAATYPAIGCDTNAEALHCAQANVAAAGHAAMLRLEPWDATALPLDTRSVNVILGDLPFGQLVGSHRENLRLYPRLLSEAARVAQPMARMVLLSHELRLLDAALADLSHLWAIRQIVGVRSGGMMPRIFVCERRSDY